MIWVTRGWQTVGRCSAKLANSWPVYDIDGKQLGNVSRRLGQLWRCWQTIGQSSAMLANSWADTCMHRPGNPHQCLWTFSIWRRAEWFWFSSICVFGELAFVSSAFLRRVNAFESSAYGEEQNDSDFSSTCVFWELAFVSSESRSDSPARAFSAAGVGCKI